ncbi:MAG: hypothetical protein ACRD22_03775 [Terriglobia bacterium]
MGKLLLFLIFSISIAGCVTGQTVRSRLHEGMSKHQVIAVMGRPDGVRKSGNYEALEYANRLISGWSWDRADYYVILKENKVVSYGPGTVRQEQPNSNVLILVPVH